MDPRLIGNWTSNGALSVIKSDPDSADGLWYLSGQSDYEMPNSKTLVYPIGTRWTYRRLDSSANQTIVGHWRHDKDPAVEDDLGEEFIFRSDGLYAEFWDGDEFFCNGTYSTTEDASGKHLRTAELRIHLQTTQNQYATRTVRDSVQAGTFAFGVDAAGTETVAFTPSDGSTASTLRVRCNGRHEEGRRFVHRAAGIPMDYL